MATKLENQELESAHYNNFKNHIPGYKDWDYETVNKLLGLGGLQVSTLFEHALANESGSEVVSQDSHDISDGSDGKLSTVRWSCKGKRYSAPVANIAGKTGDLRVQVYERQRNKFYYFVIPHAAYSHIPQTSNIEITFNDDGTPKTENRCQVNWWNYKVNSFYQLATVRYNAKGKRV